MAKKKIKKQQSKPVQLIKAVWSCAIIFCIPGLILTYISPSFTIKLSRVNLERIDATVYKNLLMLVPIARYTATNLQEVEASYIDGGVIREEYRSTGKIIGEAEDHGLLLLKSPDDPSIEVWISPKSLEDVAYDVRYFLTESKEASLRLWVVSNWKFGALLPGGILVFSVVVFCISVWSIFTGRSLESQKTSAK